MRRSVFGLLLLVALVITACGGAGSAVVGGSTDKEVPVAQSAGDTMMKEDDSHAMDDSAASTDDAMTVEPSDDPMMEGDDSQAMDGSTASTDDTMTEESSDDAMMKEDDSHAMDDSMTASEDDSMMESSDDMAMHEDNSVMLPAWFSVELTDVNSGASFSLAEQKGKVVLVENIAVWCSNCLRQQKQVLALRNGLGQHDDLVYLALDIDANETAEILANHAARNGFDWLYAVAPRDVAREIGQLYGDQFLNPPSTPMFIVDRHGEVHPLPFGIKSADELQAALEPFLSESM